MPSDKSTPPISLPINFALLPRNEQISERVLVACSGGADSLALLLALHEQEYSLVAAHINHGTRGAESDEDESFVRASCAQLGVPCAVARLQGVAGDEATLRAARYHELVRVAREYSCPRVAVGHTADDMLETILLHLLRDGTVAGWSGIPPQRELSAGVLLVRPLLTATRGQVREYLQARGYDWREDSSNRNPQYLRNRVRHELLPKLGELSGDNASRLAQQAQRGAEILRAEFAFLDELTSAQIEELTLRAEANLLILDGLKFRVLPVALQRRVLRQAAQRLSEDALELGFERVEEVRRQVIENRRRAVWQWRRDLCVEWTGEYSGNRIRFTKAQAMR